MKTLDDNAYQDINLYIQQLEQEESRLRTDTQAAATDEDAVGNQDASSTNRTETVEKKRGSKSFQNHQQLQQDGHHDTQLETVLVTKDAADQVATDETESGNQEQPEDITIEQQKNHVQYVAQTEIQDQEKVEETRRRGQTEEQLDECNRQTAADVTEQREQTHQRHDVDVQVYNPDTKTDDEDQSEETGQECQEQQSRETGQ